MVRPNRVLIAGVLLSIALPALAAERAPPRKPFEVVKLAQGVYGFLWKNPVQDPIEGNSLFIINDSDVVVVDTGLLPSSARIMAAELRKLTRKPVRFVVNTHWHDDHHNGNQVYRKLWPGVQFIAHRDTRTDMFTGTYDVRAQDLARMSTDAARYARWAREGTDDAGQPLEAGRRARAGELAALFKELLPDFRSIRNTPPDITFDRELVLYRGGRRIELRWLGRGNTRGDVVVFLPAEGIMETGDLLVQPVPFAFGSYYEDWIATLARVDSLPAEVIFPGHGTVQRDREYLHQVQGLLRALVTEVKAAVADSASLDETRRRVTLPEWKIRFAGEDPRRQAMFDADFLAPAVERAWSQLRGEPDVLQGVN
jgi:glyoxylase-like metal-dependent hydrolase (beta-lactamase superfamily II)